MAIFTANDFTSVGARQYRVRSGDIVPLARGLWTDEVRAAPTQVVAENWIEIVGKMLPGAVISDRSAFAMRPVDGALFVSHRRTSPLELPGLTVYQMARPTIAVMATSRSTGRAISMRQARRARSST